MQKCMRIPRCGELLSGASNLKIWKLDKVNEF
uniref:Uncharacterized protein n=1 Tax=Rhizophora mucronata TaxID=61149 RepID=A0A2P2NY22_RHIMU